MPTQRLLRMLPEDIRPTYEALIGTEEKGAEWRIVKAADKISAYIKCMEERKMGNREFAEAETSTLSAIRRIDLPEVQDFMDDFVPGFGMSLDEISRGLTKEKSKRKRKRKIRSRCFLRQGRQRLSSSFPGFFLS